MYLFQVRLIAGRPYIACGNDGTLILPQGHAKPVDLRRIIAQWAKNRSESTHIYAMQNYTQAMCEMESLKLPLHVMKYGRKIV